MTRFFSWNKDPWEGFWSNQWSCVGGNDSPFTEAAAEEKTPPGQPLLPDRREEVVRKKRGERRGSLLLVGAKLEVLGGQFESQGVGSQRVDHVLVAFSTVLH